MLQQTLSLKKEYRRLLDSRRQGLTLERREAASINACACLEILLSSFCHVLSFASMQDEIDLWPINQKLSIQKKLLLPKIDGDDLRIYEVIDIKNQLSYNGRLLEPIPKSCIEFAKKDIRCILVPALGYDRQNQRIGYGKGHYDRFLSSLDPSVEVLKIGIGFHEQLLEKLPTEPHDISLDEVLLS